MDGIIKNTIPTVEKLFLVANRQTPAMECFTTGIERFDAAMDGGLRGGELVVISGETGQGKTTFARVLTANLAKVGVPSLWFTYEMQEYYLKQFFEKMGMTIDDPLYSPIALVDSSLEFIEQEAAEGLEDYACKVVFIDHLHYLIPLENSQNNMSLAVGAVVRGLKRMAVKRNIIIVLLAHTKKIYQNEELNLSSVRDSSLVCQEADYVFLVQREKAVKDRQQQKLEMEMPVPYGEDWTNFTKVKLAKNRRLGQMLFQRFKYENNNLIPEDYEHSN